LSGKDGTRVITITSGKGGVGKTNISVNLALCLAASDYRVCLFDADLGLANINILLRLDPEHDLEDVILGRRSLQDVTIRDYKGIDIIPGSSGVEKMANLGDEQIEHLAGSFSELEGYDLLLIDTSAGISKNVLAFCLASSEVMLIITPEPTSLTDAYALLKVLSLNGFNGAVRTVVNQCKNIKIAKLVYSKFKKTVKKYLHVDMKLLGIIIQDQKVTEAVKAQQALTSVFPDSAASKCIKNLSKNLLGHYPENPQAPNIRSFWNKCLQLMKSPLKVNGPANKEKEINPEPPKENVPNPSNYPNQENEQKSKPETFIDSENRITYSETGSNEKPDSLQIAEKRLSADNAGEFPESGDSLHKEQNVPFLVDKLIDSVSSVSVELQLIRKTIEDQGKNVLGVNGLTGEKQGALDHKSIILDFEGFLEKRGLRLDGNGNKQRQ
jgi:flagellar biosynthesis protein FlhG